MPLYTYKCPKCETVFDRFLKLADYKSPQTCECGTVADKQLAAPAVRGDYPGYNCPITGDWIEGRKAHNTNLRRHGCRVLEPGETQAVSRHHTESERRLDKALDETVEKFVASLPSQKLEKLANEMQAGVTATVVRQ